MRTRLLLLVTLFFGCACTQAAESIPDWLAAQLPDKTVLKKPGVHPLSNGDLLGVGQGSAHESLRDIQASRVALDMAERDAKLRIAKYLYPEMFARHKNVAIDITHLFRVFEQRANTAGAKAFVAIVVNSGDVSARPVLDDSVILDAKRVYLSPEALAYLQDPILQLGGGRIFTHKDGWIAVGVGVSPIFGGDSLAERDAMKRARMEAGEELAETIFGGRFELLEEEAETREEHNGIARMREWSSKTTRENVEGELRRAVELGYWFTNDEHVAVALAVSDLPLDYLSVRPADPAEEVDYLDWNVEKSWEYPLLNRPGLLRGGAVLVFEANALWVVGVGAGKLNEDPKNNRIDAPRSAELDAKRNIIKYLVGFSSNSETVEIEEVVLEMNEHGVDSSSIIGSLRRNLGENAAGVVKNMRVLGSWKAADGKLLYQAYAIRLFPGEN